MVKKTNFSAEASSLAVLNKKESRFLLINTFILKYLYFFGGLFISCIGNYFLISAQNLGVSPWDVFHIGISRFSPSIELGTIGIIIGLIILIPSFFMNIKPQLGTFLNIYFYGVVLNFLMTSHILENSNSVVLSLVYLFLGIIIIGIGTALYLLANAGAGPRDSLMLGLHHKTRFSIAQVRTGIEVLVVTLGFLMGGPLGIGTLIYSLTIGISVEWGMKRVSRFKLEDSLND